MNEIKPIQTYYNGYHFRSRLEARWAVFFNTAGIKYQYEPEGFDLKGTRYLPDFFLPDFDVYVEIKPNDEQLASKGDDMCHLFRDYTDRAIILCVGDPVEAEITLYAWDVTESSGGSYENTCDFVEFQERVVLCTGAERPDRDILTRNFGDLENTSNLVGTSHEFTGDRDLLWERMVLNRTNLKEYIKHNMPFSQIWTPVNRAKIAARQARFEHGEHPAF